MEEFCAKKPAYNTRDSQDVSDPSTNRAQRCLTCQIGRDGVRSTWYGRKRLCNFFANFIYRTNAHYEWLLISSNAKTPYTQCVHANKRRTHEREKTFNQLIFSCGHAHCLQLQDLRYGLRTARQLCMLLWHVYNTNFKSGPYGPSSLL